MKWFPILLTAVLFACEQPSATPDKRHSGKTIVPESASARKIGEALGWLTNRADEFFFDASVSQLLVTMKKTRISIPEKAFVRQDGLAPKGKVRLVFREYQTAGEIIASQLPMKYVSPAGDTIQFESAGMFEVRAYDEDQSELLLRAGKKVRVELMTPVDGKYNFYALNDNTRSWKEVATDLGPAPNRFLAEQQARLAELRSVVDDKPRTPVAYSPSDKLFDIKVDPHIYPEFSELGGVMWKYAGDNPKEDPGVNPKLFAATYAFMRMQPKAGDALLYAVDFCTDKDTITLDLAPVFPGKLNDRNKKRLAEKLKRFNEALAEQESLRRQSRNEARLLRSFNVDKLGIYNWDRQYKEGAVVPVIAEFTFGGRLHSDFGLASVYLIPQNKLAVIQYSAETASAFAINPNEKNQLIAVIGENEVYALSDTDIRKLHLERFRNKPCRIDLKAYRKTARTGADIDVILAEL